MGRSLLPTERGQTGSARPAGLCYFVIFSVTTSLSGCCKNAISHSLCRLALFCVASIFCVNCGAESLGLVITPGRGGRQGAMHLSPVPSQDSKRCTLVLETQLEYIVVERRME